MCTHFDIQGFPFVLFGAGSILHLIGTSLQLSCRNIYDIIMSMFNDALICQLTIKAMVMYNYVGYVRVIVGIKRYM